MVTSTETAIIGAYLVLNLASLAMYFIDKRAAIRKGRRIPERQLLLAALVAPFGAAGGMKLFRHKTRKPKFLLVYVFLALHVVLLAYLLAPDAFSSIVSFLM